MAKPNLSTINRYAKDVHGPHSRHERNKNIIEKVRAVCEKFGGMAEIGDGYVVVDTRLYKIEERTKP